MSDKLTASLTPQQWDFIGAKVVATLNAATAEARMAQDIWKALQAQLQQQPPKPNGVPAAVSVVEASP